jgi:hypothetical protein
LRAIALLAAMLVLAGCGGSFHDGTPGDSVSPDRTSSWQAVPAGPLSAREHAVGIWTGEEVLLIGGSDAPPCPPSAECAIPPTPPLADGAAFDPATGSWRSIAPAPLPVDWAEAVVSGGVAYLWVPGGPRPGERPAFLAYDIDGDRWTELPLPTEETSWYRIALGGERIVAYSGSDEEGERPDFVYDADADAWEELPDDPHSPAFDRLMVWSAAVLVLLDHELVANPGSEEPSLLRVATFDFGTEAWSPLPQGEVLGGPVYAADGRLVLAGLGTADGGNNDWGRDYPLGGILDVATGGWSPLPELPVRVTESTFAAGVVSEEHATYWGTNGWVLDLHDGRWLELPRRERDQPIHGETVVTAGRDLFVFGGARFESGTDLDAELLADAWLWSPGAIPPPEPPVPETSPAAQALDCADPVTAETPYPGGAGVPGPRHAIPDAWLIGLDNTDRIDLEPSGLVVVERDERRVGAVYLVPADGETWWIESFAACRDAGIRVDWPPPPVPADVPDVAEIRCDEKTTELSTPFVRPQRDGVHVRFVNNSSGERSYSLMTASGGGGNGGGPGTYEDVWTFGPGRATVVCSDPLGEQDPSEIPHTIHLTIVDPEGLFVPTALTGCLEGEAFTMFADFAPGTPGEPGDPVEVARRSFAANNGLRADDIVERAGYPDEPGARVRMVRDGTTVVVATLTGSSEQGWLIGSASGCAGFEQSYEPDAGVP